MNILKNDTTGVLHRVFNHNGQDRLAMAVMVGFTLDPPGRLLLEDQMWTLAADHLGRDQVLDLGMPKPRGEVLAAALACSEGERPVTGLKVGLRVGEVAKDLVVFGDRFWLDPEDEDAPPTSSAPFTVMDITWRRAFGGFEYGPNPVGKGLAPVAVLDNRTAIPLPNIEYPDHLVDAPEDRPSPAGFGPLGLDWPDRLKNLGTFDQEWLVKKWPGLPDDFDFGYFNLAPRDQQQKVFFKGDEPIETLNLHPNRPRLSSALPSQRARLFVRLETPERQDWIEIGADLDTVWLFPHLNAGILIWHGTVAVADDEAQDVTHLMVGLEHLDQAPLSAVDHETRLAVPVGVETDQEHLAPLADQAIPATEKKIKEIEPAGIEAALGAGVAAAAMPEVAAPDLTPPPKFPEELARFAPLDQEPPPGADPAAMAAHYEAQAALEEERLKNFFRELGTDPDTPLPPMDKLPEEISRFAPLNQDPPPGAGPEAMAAHYEAQAALEEERLKNFFRELGTDPDAPLPPPEEPVMPSAQAYATDLEQMPGNNQPLIEAVMDLDAQRVEAEGQTEALAAQARAETAASGEADGERSKPEPDLDVGPSGLPDAEPIDPDGQAISALKDSAGGALEEAKALETDLPENSSQALKDLTGRDLTSMDLAGADLNGAVLENADLSGLDLTGISMIGAVMSRARLPGARLAGAKLAGVNASGAVFKGADLSGIDLSGADLTGADLSGADLSGADLTKADLSEANLTGARLVEAQAEGAMFMGADLAQADLTQAHLPSTDFSGSILTQTHFSKADLSGAWLSNASGEGAGFSEAKMSGAKAEGQTSLPRADFSQAELRGAYFENVDFSNGNFSRADLSGAGFQNCTMTRADLSRSTAKKADLTKSDLSGANLTLVNLMEGSLCKARLTGADLTGANLFAVDLYRSIHGATKLEGANLKRTLLDPEVERS